VRIPLVGEHGHDHRVQLEFPCRSQPHIDHPFRIERHLAVGPGNRGNQRGPPLRPRESHALPLDLPGSLDGQEARQDGKGQECRRAEEEDSGREDRIDCGEHRQVAGEREGEQHHLGTRRIRGPEEHRREPIQEEQLGVSASRGRDGEAYQDDVDDTPGIERPQPGRGLEQPSPREDRDQGSAPPTAAARVGM